MRDANTGKIKWMCINSEQIYAFNSDLYQQKMESTPGYLGLVEKFIIHAGENTSFNCLSEKRGKPVIAPFNNKKDTDAWLFPKNVAIKVELRIQLLTMTEFM